MESHLLRPDSFWGTPAAARLIWSRSAPAEVPRVDTKRCSARARRLAARPGATDHGGQAGGPASAVFTDLAGSSRQYSTRTGQGRL